MLLVGRALLVLLELKEQALLDILGTLEQLVLQVLLGHQVQEV